MNIFNQENQSVGIQVNSGFNPKYHIGQRVICRVDAGEEKYDLRCKVLDVVYSELNGYLYQLSGLKDYLRSDIKPESEIKPDIRAK